jgi:pimeloyl-ACP methyl ester carboxylesterase
MSSRGDTSGQLDRHFIQEVADGTALVQGHSLGGAVAVQVASTAPELVSGLFLEDPPLYFVNDLNDLYRTLFNGPLTMITGNPDLGAVISSQESTRVTDIVSDSRVLQLDDVGHLIHDERPNAWLSALNDWINRTVIPRDQGLALP